MYKYKRPEGRLTKVSIRKWNKTFGRRGRWPMKVAYVYFGEDKATIHYKIGIVGKMILLALFPLWYIIGLVQVGHAETMDELKVTLFQNKYGSFGSDVIYKNADGWFKLKILLGHYVRRGWY